MSSVAAGAIAASISPASSTSSASIRPSGLSAGKSRLKKIAWRVGRSPTNRGSRRFAQPGTMPSLRAGRLKYDPRSAITRSSTSRIWHEPPIANDSTTPTNGFSRRSSSHSADSSAGSARSWPRYIFDSAPSSRSSMNSTSEIFP